LNSSQRNNLQKQLPPLDRQTSSTTDEQQHRLRVDSGEDYGNDDDEGPKKNYEQLNLDKLKQMQEERQNEQRRIEESRQKMLRR
jgi:hypothetical protein